MSSSSNSTELVSMVPWLHFAGGDRLFFQSWHPSSKAAIAGASIGLLLLALFDRWLSAFRVVLESRWRQRALAMRSTCCPTSENGNASSTSSTKPDDKDEKSTPPEDQPSTIRPSAAQPRPEGSISVPFILAHDLPRGAIHALQILLGYSLMLAVMTFQAAYIISIIIGLGIGETLFGRMGGRRH